MNATRPRNAFPSSARRDRSRPARRWIPRWARWQAAICVFAIALPWIAGCGGESPDFNQLKKKQADVIEQRDPLSRAFDYLSNLHEYDAARVQPRVLYYLNQWIGTQRPGEPWPVDSLFERLPSKLTQDLEEDELTRRDFRPSDVDMLRECVWMRDISQSLIIRARDRESRAAASDTEWRDRVSRELGERTAQDLQICLWLFDWTVRNIQLDPMPEAPAEVAGPQPDQTGTEEPDKDRIEPVRVVPGGTLTPWETLMLGHGDALERAKVFIGLARQQGIDVVMLHPDEGSAREGWLAAALLGDQLFLVDTALGLPIPGPNGRPVATLAEAMADPKILRALDVDGNHVYPLAESEIKSMVAYIDAPHELLALRMHLLENELAGDRKLVLTAAPDALSKRLRKCPGVANVRLWLPPYETRRYRFEFSRLMAKLAQARRTGDRRLEARVLAAYDNECVGKLNREMQIFAGLTPIAQGRLLQFQGDFDRQGRRRGAKAYFMDCRPPEEAFEQMKNDKSLQRELQKMNRLPDIEDEKLMRRAIELQVAAVRRIKQNASYWLGLIAYEDGQYDAAIHFFDQQTLQASPDGPWTDGARYNLGRAYEVVARQTGATDKYEQAIQWYRTSQSPQRHGNLLRARRLEAEVARLNESATPEDDGGQGPVPDIK